MVARRGAAVAVGGGAGAVAVHPVLGRAPAHAAARVLPARARTRAGAGAGHAVDRHVFGVPGIWVFFIMILCIFSYYFIVK